MLRQSDFIVAANYKNYVNAAVTKILNPKCR